MGGERARSWSLGDNRGQQGTEALDQRGIANAPIGRRGEGMQETLVAQCARWRMTSNAALDAMVLKTMSRSLRIPMGRMVGTDKSNAHVLKSEITADCRKKLS